MYFIYGRLQTSDSDEILTDYQDGYLYAYNNKGEIVDKVKRVAGWNEIGNDWYYVSSKMNFVDGIYTVNGKEYYFENGRLIKSSNGISVVSSYRDENDEIVTYVIAYNSEGVVVEKKKAVATTIDKMDSTTPTMDSTTPTMGISVEYTTTTTAEVADDIKEEREDKFNCPDFKIENIDFGIVERARQDLALRKRVNTFKVTLANGQVIADMTIDEKGNIKGERNHVTYMGPSSSTGNGFVKLELDNELIQGATVEVEYEIKVTNNSELDYVSEEFYKYGIKSGNEVTITPTSIIDYLDKNWGFECLEKYSTDYQIKKTYRKVIYL